MEELDLSGMIQQAPVKTEQAPVKTEQAMPVKTKQAMPVKAAKLSQADKEYISMNMELEQKLVTAYNNYAIVDSVIEVKEWSDDDVDNSPIYLKKLTNSDFLSLLDLLTSITQAQDFIINKGYITNEIVGDIMVIDVRDKQLPDYLDLSEFKILYDWLKTASMQFKLDVWGKVQKVKVGSRVQVFTTYITPISMQSLMNTDINIGEGNIERFHELSASKNKNGADSIKSFTIPLRSYKIIKPIIGLYKSYPFLKNRSTTNETGLFIVTSNASNNKESETKIFDRDVFADAGYDISNNVKFSKTSFEFPFSDDVVCEIYPMYENEKKSQRKFTALIHSSIKSFDVKLLYVGSLSNFTAITASSKPISIETLEL